MRKILFISLLLCFLGPDVYKTYGMNLEKEITKSISPSCLQIYNNLGIGINADRAFSREENGKLNVNYDNDDFIQIKKAGFKHVRLTIRVPIMDELNPEKISADDIKVIKGVIDQILANNLIVVFNPVHPSNEFKKRLESEPNLQAAFIKFWGALAVHFNSYKSNDFVVEPFNEPHFENAEKWYLLQEKLVNEIRKAMPMKTIIVTPVTETITVVTSMKPLNDNNVLYSFHFYLPFELTHQGADWTWKYFPAGYTYPNNKWNKERMKTEFFDPLKEWTQRNNILVYGGEYGVINKADRESRLNWFKDVGEIMKGNKYPGAVWEYKSGSFSIHESTNNSSNKFDNDFLKFIL